MRKLEVTRDRWRCESILYRLGVLFSVKFTAMSRRRDMHE
jgi:hypothetical protein